MGYSDAYIGGYGAGTGDVLVGLYLETDEDVWEDLSADLISGNTIRGRQSALDSYQAGTCSVILANEDRTYDPTYAASPLNGHILPMKRVQLLATYDGEQYPLFFGYADRWTQNREGPRWGTTELAATDGFKLLARARLPQSAYVVEVGADAPVHWWRLGEPSGTTAFDVGSTPVDGTYVGGPELGDEGPVVNDPDTAVTFDGSDDYVSFPAAARVTGFPYSIELWLKISERASTGNYFFYTQSSGVGGAAPYGYVTGTDLGDPGKLVFDSVTSTGRVDDGAWHHVVLTASSSGAGAQTLWIDGVSQGTGTATAPAGDQVLVGWPYIPGFFAISRHAWPGSIDEVAIYNTDLAGSRIQVHNAAARTPWTGDLSGARLERILDAVGWPDDLRDVDNGQTTLQSAELDMSALEHAQKVEQTENGNLYVKADGTLRFEDRTSDVNQTHVATFSDDAGGDLPITFSNPEISDEQIRNDVTVSRLQGTAQTVRDDTSIAAYQISSYVRDGLYHDDDEYSRYLAQFILQAYKDPVERVSSMTVNPYRDPDNLFPVVLALELTDRLILNETPQAVTPEVSRTVVVEGISHTFAGKSWGSTFSLSENTAQTQAYWQLGVAGFGELGQTTRLFV